MKEQILEVIEEVIRWGTVMVDSEAKEAELEKDLINLYQFILNLPNLFDDNEYADTPENDLVKIKEIVSRNFPNYGFYKTVSDVENFDKEDGILTGDSIDDLVDIINDLLKVKWRINNTCINDAIYILKHLFDIHFSDHIISLLGYIRKK